MEFRRGLAICRDFEDVFVDPVARSTAAAAATTMRPTTAVKRRQLIWIPLLSECPVCRESYISQARQRMSRADRETALPARARTVASRLRREAELAHALPRVHRKIDKR